MTTQPYGWTRRRATGNRPEMIETVTSDRDLISVNPATHMIRAFIQSGAMYPDEAKQLGFLLIEAAALAANGSQVAEP